MIYAFCIGGFLAFCFIIGLSIFVLKATLSAIFSMFKGKDEGFGNQF